MGTSKIGCLALFFLTLVSGFNAWADPLDTWQDRTPSPAPDPLLGVAYGNGIFVAVGSNGAILTSLDGAIWTSRSSGTSASLSGVTYGGGKFVVVGFDSAIPNGTILTSATGESWTPRTSGTSQSLSGVAYGVVDGKGMFVALGANGTLLTSADGEMWSSQSLGVAYELLGVTFGKGTFVVVGNDTSACSGQILASANGMAWTSKYSLTSNPLIGAAFGGGTFAVVGNDVQGTGGTILTSTEADTWTPRFSEAASLYGVNYGNGTFVAVGSATSSGSGVVFTSPAGEAWTLRSPGMSTPAWAVAYGNGTFVAVGSWASGVIAQSGSPATLTVEKAGTGSGTVVSGDAKIDCGATCSATYPYDTPASLTATASAGSTFTGWSGDPDCSDGQVTLDADKTCTATFILNTYDLTVNRTGTGGGTVASNPTGIPCGANCSRYAYGTVVTLIPEAAACSTFTGWTGDADCADGSVTMDGNKTCSATFKASSGISFGVEPCEGTLGTEIDLSGTGFGAKKGKVMLQGPSGTFSLKVLEWPASGSGVIRVLVSKGLEGSYDVAIQLPKTAPVVEKNSFSIRSPRIDSVSPPHGPEGEQAAITGWYFGVKKGKVTIGGKSCKVVSWTMDKTTGASTVHFLIPKGLGHDTPYPIKVISRTGEGADSFTAD